MKNRNKKEIYLYSILLFIIVVLGIMVNVLAIAIWGKALAYPFEIYLMAMLLLSTIVVTVSLVALRLSKELANELVRLINSKNP